MHSRPTVRLSAPFVVALVATLTLAGCSATKLRNTQLEKVAKDWSLVIRASQVIPVYPLTEDLQPGDVLLVSMPVENQVALYKKRGFLPLDQHLIRLYSDQFREFYGDRYGVTEGVVPPAQWQANGWESAPHAAFPTYQFSVRTGSGMNLAIPISGVPFAMGLMNSGRASGSVTIADAYTYGLDNVKVEQEVREWARMNRGLLRGYGPGPKGELHYLRVVARVYVTGRVDVSLSNDEATSFDGGAGADRPVELIRVQEGDTDGNYSAAIGAINDLLADSLPGARVKISTASSRSVTMAETFDRPLVLGYVGFDLPVLTGGRLGAPISTLSQLNDRVTLTGVSYSSVYRLAALAHMNAALQQIEGDDADEIRAGLDSLASTLPARYAFQPYEQLPGDVQKTEEVAGGQEVAHAGFSDVLHFLGYASTTVEALEGFLPGAPRDTDEERARAAELSGELEAARQAVEGMDAALAGRPELMEAIDFVFLGAE